MNDNNPYAAQFMTSINNPQPPAPQPRPKGDYIKLFAIIGAALIVVIIIVIVCVGLANRNSTPKIAHTGASIMLVPLNATAEINGEKYTNGTYYFRPGKYTAHIAADGFAAKDVEFEVEEAKLTTVASYLLTDGGAYSEEDYDLLRFLSDSDETDQAIEAFLLENGGLNMVSYDKGLMPIEKVPLGNEYTADAKELVAETVSAYFYYAHPEITSFESVEPSKDGKTFVVIIGDKQKYTVNFVADKDETQTVDTYNISYVSLQKWGSDDEVFWYDGSFSLSSNEPMTKPTGDETYY